MVKEMAPGVWNMSSEDAGFYLICGADACLLLDSGFGGCQDLPDQLRALAGARPIRLVNTHYHMDHAGGNHFFPAAYAHPGDFGPLRDTVPQLYPLREGMRFFLGGRTLEVLECPGHTPGGIALLDRENRLLFSGDMIATVPIWMQGADTDLQAYMRSMDKFLSLEGDVELVLGCHGPMPQSLALCRPLKALAADILAGRNLGKVMDMHRFGGPPDPVRVCRGDGVSMFRHV